MEAILMDSKIWIALAFALFMGIFFRYATAPILGSLDARSRRIKEELEAAIRLREEAQELLAEYLKRQKEMQIEAESLLEASRREAASLRNQAEKSLNESLERRRKLAESNIARAETDAVADIKNTMARIAIEASRHLLQQELDETQQDTLIQDAAGDAKRLLH